MLIFAIIAGLAAGVVAALCWPLVKTGAAGPARSDYDQAVFRDQLAELERDKARGLIGAAEAEAARNEIARRLIAASKDDAASGAPSRNHWAVVSAAALIPALSIAFYLFLGRPLLPDMPLETRLAQAVENNDLAALIAKVEAHLAKAPNDVQGWEVLAPAYRRVERYGDAASAYLTLMRLKGPTPALYADYGEMLVLAESGLVPKAAAAAFEEALRLDGKSPKARFYMGLALKQDGKTAEARALWQALLADTRPGDSWRDALERQLASLAPAAAGAPALSDDQIAAGQAMSDGDRQAMITGMVEGLEDKLKAAPDDLDGWQRLIRARVVLGEMDKARGAYGAAKEQFKDRPEAVASLTAAAKQLGIEQ